MAWASYGLAEASQGLARAFLGLDWASLGLAEAFQGLAEASQGLAEASHGLDWASLGLGGGRTYVRTDGRTEILPCVLQDIIPFGSAAQKEKRKGGFIVEQKDELDGVAIPIYPKYKKKRFILE